MICDTCGKQAASGQHLNVVPLRIVARKEAWQAADQYGRGAVASTTYEAQTPVGLFICHDCIQSHETREDLDRIVPAVMATGIGMLGLFLILRRPFGDALGTSVCSGITLIFLVYGLVSLWRWFARRQGIAAYVERSRRRAKLVESEPEVRGAVHSRLGDTKFCSVQDWDAYQRTKQLSSPNMPTIYDARPWKG